jgi:hypothetical protein
MDYLAPLLRIRIYQNGDLFPSVFFCAVQGRAKFFLIMCRHFGKFLVPCLGAAQALMQFFGLLTQVG